MNSVKKTDVFHFWVSIVRESERDRGFLSYLLMAFFKYCCSHLVSGLMQTSLLLFSLALQNKRVEFEGLGIAFCVPISSTLGLLFTFVVVAGAAEIKRKQSHVHGTSTEEYVLPFSRAEHLAMLYVTEIVSTVIH